MASLFTGHMKLKEKDVKCSQSIPFCSQGSANIFMFEGKIRVRLAFTFFPLVSNYLLWTAANWQVLWYSIITNCKYFFIYLKEVLALFFKFYKPDS